MILKYEIDIDKSVIIASLTKLLNQIYKLLPTREEGANWTKPLETILVELAGLSRLLFDQQPQLFALMCKLEGLFTLDQTEDFQLYRRSIFECLGLLGELIKTCQDSIA